MHDLLEKFNQVHGPKESFEAECTQLFKRAILALNEKYTPGTYDYVYQNRKELYQQIVALENELDKFWGNDIQAFREVLARYYRHTLKCIQVYKKSLNFF